LRPRAEVIKEVWDSLVYYTDRASVYESLTYLGTRRGEPIPEVVDSSLHPNLMASYISQSYLDWFNTNKGDFCVSKSCVKTLDKSCMKLDNIPVSSYLDEGGFHRESLEFMADMYSSVWASPVLDHNQILERLTFDSACGLIENIRGMRTKGDCIYNNLDTLEYEPNILPTEIALWKVSGKVEIKKVSDYIGKDKQRTFIIQPIKSLWNHMKLYSSQNDALKLVGWSAYGFNPYEGGVDRLARSLLRLKLKRFWTLDVVGWDRIYPFLRDVYDIKSCLLPKDLWDLARKVVDDICQSVLCFPNGDFVCKSWGNNSGSGSTTADNIFGMTVCIVHVFFYLVLSKRQIEESVVAFIFGDDVIGSDDFSFISDDELRNAFTFVFGLYGFTLDPLIITHDLLDPEVTFLGFSFAQANNGFYVPKYPLDRLCSSFIFDDTKEADPDKELAKMMSLMLMSAGHGKTVFDFFRNSLVECLIASNCDTAVRIRKLSHVNVAIPFFDDVISWYSGYESLLGLTFTNFFEWKFFQDGGWHKEFLFMESHKKNNSNVQGTKQSAILKKNAEKEKKYKAAGDESLRLQLQSLRSQLNRLKNPPKAVSLPKKSPGPPKVAPGKGLLFPQPSKKGKKKMKGQPLAPVRIVGKSRKVVKRRQRSSPNAGSWKAWNKAKPLRPQQKKVVEVKPQNVEGHYGRETGRHWYDTAADVVGSLLSNKGDSFSNLVDIYGKVSGLGDYDIDTNSIAACASHGQCGNDIPMMVNSKVCNTIRHREYLGDVYSSDSNFSAIQFSINPGLFSTFPWLAPIANCFTSYRMRGLIYEFNSLSTEYSAQTSLGFVALGTQYNTIDPPFSDKISMLNSEYANSRKPSETFIHAVECAGNQLVLEQLYVRDQGPPNDTDIRFYDLGTLTLACGGQSENDEIIGELWSSYEVEFFQPKNDFQFSPLFDSWQSTEGYTNSHCLIGDGANDYNGPNGLPEVIKSITNAGSALDKITFFSGVYGYFNMIFNWTSGTANAATWTPPTFTYENGVELITGSSTYFGVNSPSAGSSTYAGTVSFVVKIADTLDPNALPYINCVGGGSTSLPGGTNYAQIMVSQVTAPDGPGTAIRPLTKKAGKIWEGRKEKFQWMKMHDELSSESSDSSSDDETPLDLIVRATDGTISMSQQAMLLKLYTEMMSNQPQASKCLDSKSNIRRTIPFEEKDVPKERSPLSQVKVTTLPGAIPSKVMKLAGKDFRPAEVSDFNHKIRQASLKPEYADIDAYHQGLKESNDLLMKQVLRHRDKINELEREKMVGLYDSSPLVCDVAIYDTTGVSPSCDTMTTCPF